MEGLSLEIDPSRFIIALGPGIVASLLQHPLGDDGANSILNTSASPDPKLPAVDVKSIVKEGIDILLESRQFQSAAERAECECLYSNALEVEPIMKLSTTMQQCGRYAEWLERCFRLDAVPGSKSSPLLSHLVKLHDSGALLLYTGCDDALSKLANLQVLLAQEKESVVQWCNREKKGIMHVHGVYWKPDSLQLNCEVYNNPNHPSRAAMELLGAVLEKKFIISLGVCETGQLEHPMIAKFTRTFLTVASQRHCFNFGVEALSSDSSKKLGAGLLHMPLLRSHSLLPGSVNPLTEFSQMLCKCIILFQVFSQEFIFSKIHYA